MVGHGCVCKLFRSHAKVNDGLFFTTLGYDLECAAVFESRGVRNRAAVKSAFVQSLLEEHSGGQNNRPKFRTALKKSWMFLSLESSP